MKWLAAILIFLLLGLQYRLWVGEGSIAHRIELQQQIEQQQAENAILKRRNERLALEIEALKNGTEGVEERAREELGLVKEDEIFFMIIDDDNTQTNPQDSP